MRVIVNGESQDVTVRTLLELCAMLGFSGQKIATARNGAFVAEKMRGEIELNDGDHIEILTPRQGG